MPGVPIDTSNSEDNVFKYILEEETNLFVSILQSNDLPSEFKDIKVDSEFQDFNPKQEKSDRVQVLESQSQIRGTYSLPQAQKSIPWTG